MALTQMTQMSRDVHGLPEGPRDVELDAGHRGPRRGWRGHPATSLESDICEIGVWLQLRHLALLDREGQYLRSLRPDPPRLATVACDAADIALAEAIASPVVTCDRPLGGTSGPGVHVEVIR